VTGTDQSDAPDEGQTPIERVQEHLDEVSDRPDEMQERLDDLGESIEATRRRAEEHDLLPDDAAVDTAGGRDREDINLPPAPESVEADDPGGAGDGSAAGTG
jgi:hypothetical protein